MWQQIIPSHCRHLLPSPYSLLLSRFLSVKKWLLWQKTFLILYVYWSWIHVLPYFIPDAFYKCIRFLTPCNVVSILVLSSLLPFLDNSFFVHSILSPQLSLSLSRISLALNIIMSPPIPLLPSPLQIMLYNIPLPQPFIPNLKKTCIKSTLKLGSYLKIPYFCTRFPREESLSYLTNCKSVNQVKTKNKKTSKKFWKQ